MNSNLCVDCDVHLLVVSQLFRIKSSLWSHTLAAGLDGFLTLVSWSEGRLLERGLQFFFFFLNSACVFLNVTRHTERRARNTEPLPKSVTTNGCNDLAGGTVCSGGWTDAERDTHTHTHAVYLDVRLSMHRFKKHTQGIHTHSSTCSHSLRRHSCLPCFFLSSSCVFVCVCVCVCVCVSVCA